MKAGLNHIVSMKSRPPSNLGRFILKLLHIVAVGMSEKHTYNRTYIRNERTSSKTKFIAVFNIANEDGNR